MYGFGKNSLDNLKGVDNRLVELMKLAISRSPIDFGVPENGGLRTAECQNQLYRQRVSKADGYKIKSNHQKGIAVDVYAYVNGQASWDKEHLAIIAGVVLSTAAEIGLSVRWGGTFGSDEFKGWDLPHYELI